MIPNYSYPLEHFLIIDNHDFHMEKKRTKRIHGNRLYYRGTEQREHESQTGTIKRL